MISFLLRKIWKNKWMMICLLIGNILLIGIVSATPLYINATMRRILYQGLRQHQIEYEIHPATMALRYNFNNIAAEFRIPTYLETRDNFAYGILEELDVPAIMSIRTDTMQGWHLWPYPPRDVNPRSRSMNVAGISGFSDNVYMIHGRLPATELVNGHIIEAVISEAAMQRHHILYDEMLYVRNVSSHVSDNLYVHIVGVYRIAEGSEMFWSVLDITHLHEVITAENIIKQRFIPYYTVEFRIATEWVHVLDYSAMTARDVDHYLTTLTSFHHRFDTERNVLEFTENFSDTVRRYSQRADRLAITLWVLQVPIYVLLAFYIYMVSRQILQLEQNEISVIKSRGASRRQILGIYSLQGLIVAAICYPAGIALGVALCNVLGASNGFLELVQRTAIVVEITPDVLFYAGFAMFLSFLTMFIPVIGFSAVGIVSHKRRNSASRKPVWQRFFLDILCLGIAIYGLYSFSIQREAMAMAIRDSQSVDPLLFLSSSLFIMGLGLFFLRIFPYILRVLFRLGRRFWSPAAYASLIKVIRSSGEEQFIMIFLLFTLSVGTFSAQAARTVNLNNDHHIRYMAGADLMFRESWRSEITGGGDEVSIVFFEPDFERFTAFEEVESLTRVLRQDVTARITVEHRIDDIPLMAIETDTFGETVWFRRDLLRTHINHYLNALAGRSDGVLLSRYFQTDIGMRLGDAIHITDPHGNTVRVVAVGFIDYWPSFAPIQRVEVYEQITELRRPIIVANLGYLQSQRGVQPYQVWMRTNTESSRFFRDFVEENRINIVEYRDANAELIESRSDPILQGTNGVLTVGFIVTLLICFTGFLIYWILSLRSRVLQFGIFRAMGMSMRNLIGLLINEQFYITFTSIALGALVGEISARLFVPLIQISYTAADQVIPLMVVNEIRDYGNLYTVIGIMIVLCLIVLAAYISRIKIAQALKLGED